MPTLRGWAALGAALALVALWVAFGEPMLLAAAEPAKLAAAHESKGGLTSTQGELSERGGRPSGRDRRGSNNCGG